MMILKLSFILIMAIILAFMLSRYMIYISYGRHLLNSKFLSWLDYKVISVCKINEGYQSWQEYLQSAVILYLLAFFSLIFVLTFQQYLPLNPQNYSGVPLSLAFNIASSFVTTANWQEYQGELILSHLSQVMITITAFACTSIGMCCGISLIKSLSLKHSEEREIEEYGNFWVDYFRLLLFVLIPICFCVSVLFISSGVIQNFSPFTKVYTLEGFEQIIPQGPAAAFESISIFGVNGGGMFGSNSAHPFENPTPATNLLQMILMLVIPLAIIFVYGEILNKKKHSWLVIGLIIVLLFTSVYCAYNPIETDLENSGYLVKNMEGKEVRFGILDSTIFYCLAAATSGASVASIESFDPMAHVVFLTTILFGGAMLGGAGSGICNLLIFVIIGVFFAGLMSGRSPRFMGRDVGFTEVKYITIYFVITQCLLITFSTIAIVNHEFSTASTTEGFIAVKQALFTYSASISNNGMGLGQFDPTDSFLNISTAISMLVGKFVLLYCVFKVVESLREKKIISTTLNEVQIDHWFFAFLIFFAMLHDFMAFVPLIIMGPVMEYVLNR